MPESLGGTQINLNTNLRTYEEIRAGLLTLAASLTPEWTDFYPHDPGVVILEAVAAYGDLLNDYIDRAVSESHWSTAQKRDSLVRMASLIGYTPKGSTFASVDVDVVVDTSVTLTGIDTLGSQPFRIGLTAGNGQRAYEFELLETTTLAAGTHSLTFVEGKTEIEIVGSSNGLAGQEYTVTKYPVTVDLLGRHSTQVEVFEGGSWIEYTNPSTNNLFTSEATDKHFIFSIDAKGKLTIRFGDGVNGAIPTLGSSNIRVKYRVGGGSQANFVGAGRITSIKTPVVGVVSVSNPASPSGGDDVETVEEIRKNAPAFFSTSDRIVTTDDYINFISGISGIAKAKVAPYKDSPIVQSVYIAATGNNPVPTGTWDFTKQSGTGFLGTVGALLKEKILLTLKLQINPITPLDLGINVEVVLRKNYKQAQVLKLVSDAIYNYISDLNSTEIRSTLPLSEFIDVLHNTEGVQYVNVLGFHRTAYIEPVRIGYADTTFSSVTIGPNTLEETLTIRFLTPTTFEVEGSASGLQPYNGTVGTAYQTINGEAMFTFSAGTIPNKEGDEYKIVVGKLVGNVIIQENEIPVLLTAPTITVTGGIPI